MLGYSNSRHLIGRTLMEFAVRADGSLAETATPLARGDRPFWSREVKLQCRDGSPKWAILNDAQIDPGFEEGGPGVPVFEGWVVERTRERELEGLLLRQESLFMTLFSAIADAMLVLDDRGVVVSCNQATEVLLGESLERLMGHHFTDCFSSYTDATGAELKEEQLSALKTLASGETSDHDLIGLTLSNGKRLWARMRSTAVNLPGGSGATSVVVSLADQTQLRLLEEKLVDAQKLEVASLAANGMTHDLRNAVTSMSAVAELIAERDDSLANAKEHAGQIRGAAAHAHSIVSQILGFTRHRDTRLSPVELDPVVASLEDLMRGIVPPEISLRLDLDAAGLHVSSTVGFLEQIVLNLLINGRDAMRSGGALTVQTEEAELASAKIFGGHELDAGRYVLLSVVDEGEGMEAPVRQRAFEPFFTTKGRQEGTGLGLWSVRNLSQRSGGDAVIESAPGKGTTVRVYLPIVDPAAASGEIEN